MKPTTRAYFRGHTGVPKMTTEARTLIGPDEPADRHRVNAFNKAAHNKSMAATMRWADKLAQKGRTRLPHAG